MLAPALPLNEQERLQALHDLRILDTAPEERFDRLVRITRALFNVPIVLISLVDSNRQWFKACLGLDADSTARDISFCGHAIHFDDILHIPDALRDIRFFDNPLVTGAPHIRFYAGAPLRVNGQRIGTLCLIDRTPRMLNDGEFASLRDLADAVEQQFAQQDAFEAARQINRHQLRLDGVFRTVPDGLLIVDHRGRIDTANPASGRLFGLPPEHLAGRPVRALLDPDCLPEFDARVAAVAAGRADAGVSFEVEGRHDNGPIPLELTLSQSRIDDETLMTVVARDIRARRQLEIMKDEFISTVSHELRTPLTSIRGALGLILGKNAAGLPERARQLLDTAARNADRLTLLINDILDLEKIASGRMEFTLRPMDIAALTRQALQAHEGYAARHQVRLALTECPPALWVNGDEHRLMQVFANLLSNAIKYSPADGVVEITVRPDDDRVHIGIRDHGRGVPDSFRQNAFQRFAQADSSDTRDKGGTGLGLSIVKAIIDRHGGQVDYESTPGQGAYFYLELPAIHGDAQRGH